MGDGGAAATADRFSLDLPPTPPYVIAARLFAAAVARHYGCEEDAIEDLKLAVSEACSTMVRDQPDDRHLRVTAELRGDRLGFEVMGTAVESVGAAAGTEPPGPSEEEPTPESFARSVSLDVIRGLFEEAEISTEGGLRVSFSIPAVPASD